MSRGSADQAVKIVIIDTEYIETDERSFKEVVQRLTGKVSSSQGKDSWKEGRRDAREICEEANAGRNRLLSKDWSFKEFDKLISEFPISSLLSDTKID
ncbi:hypothetical protein QQ045_020032 [Rhodiola kirilowii]